MNTDEKLQHFKNEACNLAAQNGSAELDEYRSRLETEYKSHTGSASHQSEMQIRLAKENIRREHNRKVSKTSLDTRRRLTAARMEVENKLFAEVDSMISTFKAGDAYLPSLAELVAEAKKQAGDNICVSIDPEDAALKDALEKKTGVTVNIADEPIVGGILATVPGSNLLIDLSYASRLRDAKDNLKLGGSYGN